MLFAKSSIDPFIAYLWIWLKNWTKPLPIWIKTGKIYRPIMQS